MESRVRLQEARARREAGSLAEAEELLSVLIREDSSCAPAFNDRGCVRADLGDLDGALRDFAEALRLAPDYGEAQRNFKIVANLVAAPNSAAELPLSTVSSVLVDAPQAGSFAQALLEFLRRSVRVEPGHEDRREDAIQEVALRVLGLSRSEDLPLAEALKRLRRSSTRAWVSKLLGTSRRQDMAALPDGLRAPESIEAPTETRRSLRLEACLETLKASVLGSSQPVTRWRRRVVWDVYVGALLDGVHLTRKEVVAAVRSLKIGRRRATDGQLFADLDKISAALRRTEES